MSNMTKKIEIYKFRPLATCEDYCRIKDIIKTRKFHCSLFSELNDPMEGIFLANNLELVEKIYKGKMKYLICSFSGEEGFKNPLLWGYYANGFRGVAIEVEIDKSKVEKIKYVEELKEIKDKIEDVNPDESAKIILTRKNKAWKHEDEYRFLKELIPNEQKNNKQEIGEITAIYFGATSEHIINRAELVENSKSLIEYDKKKKELIEVIKTKNQADGSDMKYADVQIEQKPNPKIEVIKKTK